MVSDDSSSSARTSGGLAPAARIADNVMESVGTRGAVPTIIDNLSEQSVETVSRVRQRLPLDVRGPAPSNVSVVADALREAIVNGRIPLGERVKEAPIAEQLGVSRGPIREALRLLEHEGLVTIIPNRGAHVPTPAAPDVLEVYAMRTTLGSLALHKLMLVENGEHTPALEHAFIRLKRAVANGRTAKAAEADHSYQRTLVRSSALPRVSRTFDQLTWQVRIFDRAFNVRYDDKLLESLDEIGALHTAVLDRSAATAERLWREKCERWVRNFLEHLDEPFDAKVWLALTTGAGL